MRSGLQNGALLLLCAVSAAAQRRPLPPTKSMIANKNWFFDQAVHPVSHLIYSRIDFEDLAHWKKARFASPAAVKEKMNDDSEVPNLSNCAAAGGIFLGQLTDIYAVTQDGTCRSQARTVFDGLKSLAEASTIQGFVARGLLPGDSTKAHFLNSSVDQYTFYVYGLTKYYHSPLSGEVEKREIRRILTQICTMLDRYGTIPGSNGAPGLVSDIEVFRSDRSTRFLQMFLSAFSVTGDPHWRQVYLEKVQEADQARLKSVLDPMQLRYPYAPRDYKYGANYADISTMWQTQYSLAALADLETGVALKAAYFEAMRTCARIAEQYGGRGFELQLIMLAQNRAVVEPISTTDDNPCFRDLAGWTADLIGRTPRSAVDMPRGDRLAASMTHIGVTTSAQRRSIGRGGAEVFLVKHTSSHTCRNLLLDRLGILMPCADEQWSARFTINSLTRTELIRLADISRSC